MRKGVQAAEVVCVPGTSLNVAEIQCARWGDWSEAVMGLMMRSVDLS